MQSIVLLLLSLLSFCSSTTPEGLAYLESNKNAEGVITLPSGLQYKVLKSGPGGGLSPRVDSPCECHYRGMYYYSLYLSLSFSLSLSLELILILFRLFN